MLRSFSSWATHRRVNAVPFYSRSFDGNKSSDGLGNQKVFSHRPLTTDGKYPFASCSQSKSARASIKRDWDESKHGVSVSSSSQLYAHQAAKCLYHHQVPVIRRCTADCLSSRCKC